MSEYKRKPETKIITAWQLIDGEPWPPGVEYNEGDGMFVTTIQEQRIIVSYGEWIILEPDGAHYCPCDSEVFFERYELV